MSFSKRLIAASALALLASSFDLILPRHSQTDSSTASAATSTNPTADMPDEICAAMATENAMLSQVRQAAAQGFSVPPATGDTIPEAAIGGDISPVRTVGDPYPTLHSVAVDPENNRVVMTDYNRGGMLFFDRTAGSKSSTTITTPKSVLRGPATGMMFVAGVAIDPATHEAYTVDNDTGDRMMVFPYDAVGNVKPKRVLHVPHGSWGVSLNRKRDEIAISVEHPNTVVIYTREASGEQKPLRELHGQHTGLADPHGIVFDDVNNELVVANHGNWAPIDANEAERYGGEGGRFQAPSITTYPGEAKGDAEPTRTIQGSKTELDWPMGISVDTEHNEIAVANYASDAVLIFRRTDAGNVTPVRELHGDRTGILGPMGVAFDTQNDELWVTNAKDHSAVVFSRTASGNTEPKRVLRNAPPGAGIVGFGNPGAMAYDPKRDEILVPN